MQGNLDIQNCFGTNYIISYTISVRDCFICFVFFTVCLSSACFDGFFSLSFSAKKLTADAQRVKNDSFRPALCLKKKKTKKILRSKNLCLVSGQGDDLFDIKY